MWDFFSKIVSSLPILIAAIVFILALIWSIYYIAKHSHFRFKSKTIQIGDIAERERNIIQHQQDYIYTAVYGMMRVLPMDRLSEYKTKYILELIIDEMNKWCVFNNITDNEAYVSVKQDIVYNIVMKRATDDFFKTTDFRVTVDTFVRSVIARLLQIKQDFTI